MNTILLLIALMIETACAAYRIVTQSNQNKVRSLVWLGAFAAFILVTFVSVIQWSFRWYLLAALLFVLAVLGAWRLVRNKAEKKGYGAMRAVLTAIGMFLLICIVMIPALIFPQYAPPKVTGTHPVATLNDTYTDNSQIETFTNTGEHRKVNVEFWYPKDGDGKYPLVVFSHGTAAMKTSNLSTFLELASNGYVVCSIDHPYHSLYTMGTDGHLVTIDQAYLQEYMNLSNGKYDEATAFKLHQKWIHLRTADINFVLDTVLGQAKKAGSDAVYQLIDPEKIGLMGHSLGGESAAQVARERNDIGAVVNLDADLSGEYLDYVNGKYVMNDKVYPVPILTILGDDLVRGIAAVLDANNVIALKRVNATAPYAYEVDIAGTNHLSFTDLSLESPVLVSLITSAVPAAGGGKPADALVVIEKMNGLVLQFFNAYLKGEGTFSTRGAN